MKKFKIILKAHNVYSVVYRLLETRFLPTVYEDEIDVINETIDNIEKYIKTHRKADKVDVFNLIKPLYDEGGIWNPEKDEEDIERFAEYLYSEITGQDNFFGPYNPIYNEDIDRANEEAMGGASSPVATLNNTPGAGNVQPATSAATSGAQQTSNDSIGSGDNFGSGNMYDQYGKIKKKRKSKKRKTKKIKTITGEVTVNEGNINPYDKIGTMMAKKMGVELPFNKKDSKTNTIEQKKFKSPKSLKKFKIETLDDYKKASKHVSSDKISEGSTNRDEQALKDIKARDELERLGISYEFKEAKSGKNRTFITTPVKDVIDILNDNGWEEYGKNEENTIRKYKKGENLLSIFTDGKDYPRVTLTNINEGFIVSSRLEDYL